MIPERLQDEPPTYRATQLQPIFDEDQPDWVAPVRYEPEYPANFSELEKVCWLAGTAELDFMCRVDVVVDGDPLRPGFQLRFLAAPGKTGESLMFAGADAQQVAIFLRGMRFFRSKARIFLD